MAEFCSRFYKEHGSINWRSLSTTRSTVGTHPIVVSQRTWPSTTASTSSSSSLSCCSVTGRHLRSLAMAHHRKAATFDVEWRLNASTESNTKCAVVTSHRLLTTIMISPLKSRNFSTMMRWNIIEIIFFCFFFVLINIFSLFRCNYRYFIVIIIVIAKDFE